MAVLALSAEFFGLRRFWVGLGWVGGFYSMYLFYYPDGLFGSGEGGGGGVYD